jgi:hypothetical protein
MLKVSRIKPHRRKLPRSLRLPYRSHRVSNIGKRLTTKCLRRGCCRHRIRRRKAIRRALQYWLRCAAYTTTTRSMTLSNSTMTAACSQAQSLTCGEHSRVMWANPSQCEPHCNMSRPPRAISNRLQSTKPLESIVSASVRKLIRRAHKRLLVSAEIAAKSG